jgi:hypothetical protein
MIAFHRFLIGTAIVFCALLGVWMLSAYWGNGNAVLLVLGVTFGVAALGLSYYLRNLNRFLGRGTKPSR